MRLQRRGRGNFLLLSPCVEGTTFNSAPVSGWTVTVILCLTGHCSRAVSGRPAPLGRGPSASLAETPETHEEDVPDAHRGKPSAPPCGGPRPVHRWVHAQTEGAFLLRWPRWPRKAGVHYLCPSSVEQVIEQASGSQASQNPDAVRGDRRWSPWFPSCPPRADRAV